MEIQKNKFIEKIDSLYKAIDVIQLQLTEPKNNTKEQVLVIGSKVIELQNMVYKLIEDVNTFFSIFDGKLEELPEAIQIFYSTYNELKLTEPEEITKIKEQLKQL